jgi:hypothetical protein
MSNELWASEYGADCFGLGGLGKEEGGKYRDSELTRTWWPLYIDGEQVGHVQLDYDGTTTFGIRLFEHHTIEVRDEGEPFETPRSKYGKPRIQPHTEAEADDD